jgi:hypothetical protein
MSIVTPGVWGIDPQIENGTDLATHLNEWFAAFASTNASATRPAVLQRGGLWAKTGTGTDIALMFFDGTNDHEIGSVKGGSVSFGGVGASSTAPTGAKAGDLWVDTSVAGNPVLKIYTGAAWQSVTSSYLPLTGGTLTGALTLSGAPTTDLHAATKKYVDDADALAVKKTDVVTTGGTAAQAGKVPGLDANGKISSTMLPAAATGSMTLKGAIDPTAAAPTGAVKGDYYVANAAGTSTWVGINGQAVKSGDSLIFDGTNWHIVPSEQDLAAYLPLAGGTLTGALTLPGAPTGNLEAATKKYVDDADALSVKLTSVSTTAAAGKILQLDSSGKFPIGALPDLSGIYVTQTAGDARYVQTANFNTLGDARYVLQSNLINSGGGVAGAVGKVVQVGAGGYISTSFFKTTDTGGTAAQAGYFPILDAAGKLSQQMLDTIAAAATPTATAGAAKLVLTSATGKIDNSLISLPGVLTLKGTIDPTTTAPVGAADGDVYVVNKAGVVGASWGAPAAGKTLAVGDLIVRVNGAWEDISSTGNLAFLPLTGGTLTGNLNVNGDVVLGASSANTLTLKARIAGNLVPSATNTVDLGSGALSYRDIYASRSLFADGTAALPSIAFASDTDTGIWHPAPDTVAVSTGGTQRVTVDASGNLGVGQPSPSHIIDAYSATNGVIRVGGGSGTNQGGAFFVKNAADNNTQAAFGDRACIFGGTPDQLTSIFTSALPLTFDVAGAERMRITSAGYVGIGDTPTTYLDVGVAGNRSGGNILMGSKANNFTKYTALAATQYAYGSEPEGFTLVASQSSSSSENSIRIGGCLPELNAATDIQFYTAANATTRSGTERMRIDSKGKITIENQVVAARNGLEVGTRKLPIHNAASLNSADAVGGLVDVGADVTIPTATSGITPGDVMTIHNNAGTAIKLNGTCFLAGDPGQKTSLTLDPKGMATLVWNSAGECIVTGQVS